MATVLIADDDADHRELLGLALRRAGHDAVVTADATEAMAVLRDGGIDAALLDVRMPGETGIDLCRRLRQDAATARLPVMLISADVNDRQLLAALDAGADEFLSKPFPQAELCARLDGMLRGPAASGPGSRPPALPTWAPARAVRSTIAPVTETLSRATA